MIYKIGEWGPALDLSEAIFISPLCIKTVAGTLMSAHCIVTFKNADKQKIVFSDIHSAELSYFELLKQFQKVVKPDS